MFVNYVFVAASMAVLLVLDPSITNSVSASSGAEAPSFMRTLRRRTLNLRSTGADEESTQDKPSGLRPTGQAGVPQLGLSPAMMQKVSGGLVSSIAKFSADKEAGVEFPTQAEMTRAVDEALWTSDTTNFLKVALAIKFNIDALADRKLAEEKTGTGRLTKVSKSSLSKSSSQSSAEQIASALLDTIHMFVEQKARGGKLPDATEVNRALTPALQNIDFSDVKKGAEAVKFGLDSMGPSRNSQTQGRLVQTEA